MVEQFLNHIDRHKLCKTTDKILVAVSGGVDSMVMLDLFMQSGFQVGVAHCNFKLRGDDSDADEQFVREVCRTRNIAFFTRSFDTKAEAARGNRSTQVAARELRYSFFREIAAVHQFDAVATGHHLDDNLETLLLNLVRGTGIEGLAGIPLRSGIIIRPLLFLTRRQITEYAKACGLAWREDSSNAGDEYNRNYLRHMVIPRLRELNPSLEETFAQSIERINAGVALARQAIAQIAGEIVSGTGDSLKIDLPALLSKDDPAVILWEILKSRGFNYDQCLLAVAPHQPGRRFFAGDNVMTVDRGVLMIERREMNALRDVRIDQGQDHAENGAIALRMKEVSAHDFRMIKDPGIAQLDGDKLMFPLKWRRWRPGDKLVPLGMTGEKKVSDLLTDARIPLPEKDTTTVIESGGEIVWVAGVRISERFKVDKNTRKVLIIEIV